MKPRIINNGITTEFNTEQELNTYIDSITNGRKNYLLGKIDDAISDNSEIPFIIDQAEKERKGKELVNDLFRALKKQNLTQAEEAQIINKISVVLVALIAGSLIGAKVICTALTTDAAFTNGRKNYLLGKIDDAIAEL